MNRQKSRGLVENVLSGMKAGFKSILNIFKHPNENLVCLIKKAAQP